MYIAVLFSREKVNRASHLVGELKVPSFGSDISVTIDRIENSYRSKEFRNVIFKNFRRTHLCCTVNGKRDIVEFTIVGPDSLFREGLRYTLGVSSREVVTNDRNCILFIRAIIVAESVIVPRMHRNGNSRDSNENKLLVARKEA